MFVNYLKERYGNLIPEGNYFQVIKHYIDALKDYTPKIFENELGFFTYSLKGDAIIVWDIYVVPAFRGRKERWDLFNKIKALALNSGKNVIIGFSEQAGQNQQKGMRALIAAGFQRAFSYKSSDLGKCDVFMRGTN